VRFFSLIYTILIFFSLPLLETPKKLVPIVIDLEKYDIKELEIPPLESGIDDMVAFIFHLINYFILLINYFISQKC